jgi:hypothetical protein
VILNEGKSRGMSEIFGNIGLSINCNTPRSLYIKFIFPLPLNMCLDMPFYNFKKKREMAGAVSVS